MLNREICLQCFKKAAKEYKSGNVRPNLFSKEIKRIFMSRIQKHCCAFVHSSEIENMIQQYDEPLIKESPNWCPYLAEQVVSQK